MARQARHPLDNGIYHVLNRGNCGMDLFEKAEDFQSFIKILEEGRQRCSMRILGYCLMDNHWHLILKPRQGADLSRFMGWVCTTHVRRWREQRGNTGQGHLYQGRFRSFLVQGGGHFLTLMRYVEANPLRAGMVQQAQAWPWSSLGASAGSDGVKVKLAAWPVSRPPRWEQQVNKLVDARTLERVHLSIARGRPLGDDSWTARMAKRHGLESTLRDPWRPRKVAKKEE